MKAVQLIEKLQSLTDNYGDFDILVRDAESNFVTDVMLVVTPNDAPDDAIALVGADEDWFGGKK